MIDNVKYTKYDIVFKNDKYLQHIDIFNLAFDVVIESLLLLHSKRPEDIKSILVSYDYKLIKEKGKIF